MRKLFLFAGLLVGSLGGAIPVFAHPFPTDSPAEQAPAEVTNPDDSTDPTAQHSEPAARLTAELVVTASLEGLERDRLPFAVEVIDAEEIERRQATELSDLLATVPGLTVARSGSPGKITSLFSRGTESDHTLVLWNGIELNNPYFGGFDWAFLSTAGVSRVEVARGPYGATHGGEAVGGVVQILTGGNGDTNSTLRLEGGEDDYLRGALAASSGAWDGRAQLDFAGHIRRGDGESANDFYDSEEALAHIQLDLGRGVSLGIAARANDSDIGIPFAFGVPSPERRSAWSETQLAVPLTIEKDRWRIESQLSWVGLESRFSDPADAFGFTSSETESEATRVRFSARRNLSSEAWLVFGSEAERLEVDDQSVFGVNLTGARQKTRSAFAEVYYPIGRATLDLGLRHDDNDVFGSHLSPRLGLAVALGADARFRVSYGEGFRSPSLGELFFPFSGNPSLEPEESESVEVGVEIERSGWRFAGALFENRLTNLIDFEFSTFTNVNVGKARSRGAEFLAGFRGDAVDVTWNATLLEAEDRTTGLALLRRPDQSSNLLVSVRPRQRWLLHLTARYVGERDDVDPVTGGRALNSSFVKADLAGHWHVRSRITPYVRVENLADREYDEVLGFPAPGRRWVGGLTLEWD